MDDEQLISQFLQRGCEDIDDNGFSSRVMRHVPHFTPFWIYCACAVAALAVLALLFVVFDGWSILCNAFVRLYTSIAFARYTTINPIFFVALLGLACLGITRKVKSIF